MYFVCTFILWSCFVKSNLFGHLLDLLNLKIRLTELWVAAGIVMRWSGEFATIISTRCINYIILIIPGITDLHYLTTGCISHNVCKGQYCLCIPLACTFLTVELSRGVGRWVTQSHSDLIDKLFNDFVARTLVCCTYFMIGWWIEETTAVKQVNSVWLVSII